jgi:hypothetical protein
MVMQPILYGLIIRCPDCGTRFRRGYFQQLELVLDTNQLASYQDENVDCPNCKKTHTYKVADIAGVEYIPKE